MPMNFGVDLIGDKKLILQVVFHTTTIGSFGKELDYCIPFELQTVLC